MPIAKFEIPRAILAAARNHEKVQQLQFRLLIGKTEIRPTPQAHAEDGQIGGEDDKVQSRVDAGALRQQRPLVLLVDVVAAGVKGRCVQMTILPLIIRDSPHCSTFFKNN